MRRRASVLPAMLLGICISYQMAVVFAGTMCVLLLCGQNWRLCFHSIAVAFYKRSFQIF